MPCFASVARQARYGAGYKIVRSLLIALRGILAGVNKSAHGVRKIGATRAANNGATVAELEAIFGWTGARMASLYTQAADRVRLAKRAIEKLANEN
jgi:integrase